MFDIDGKGLPVDEMAEYLAIMSLSCVLVTSFNHGVDGLHKYRVIIEIDKPVTVPHAADVTKRMKEKQAFNQLFTHAQKIAADKKHLDIPGIDPSALGIAQFFFGPAHPEITALKPYAQVFTGEPFDLSDCMKQAEREQAQQQHRNASNGAGNPTQRDGLHLRADDYPEVRDPVGRAWILLKKWFATYKEGLELWRMIDHAKGWPGAPDNATTGNSNKHIIVCPNADEHTEQEGIDKGAIAWNASEFEQAQMDPPIRGGILCSHAHCIEKMGCEVFGKFSTDPLEMIAIALEKNMLTLHDLQDPANYTPDILLKANNGEDNHQDNTGTASDTEWDMLHDPAVTDPVNIERPNLSESFLDGDLNTLVHAMARKHATSPDYIFGTMLAVAGACIAGKAIIAYDTWKQRPVFWCALVGVSGSAKSPAIAAMTGPLYSQDEFARSEFQSQLTGPGGYLEQIEEYKADQRIHNKRVTQAIKADEPIPKFTKQKPEHPNLKRHTVQDVTQQKLAEIKSKQMECPLEIHDELVGWIAKMDQFTNAKGADRSFYLGAYDSAPFALDRKGPTGLPQAPVMGDDSGVCILGGIQPGRVKEHFTGKGLVDDGFSARIMLFNPESQYYPISDEPSPHANWHAIAAELLGVKPKTELDDNGQPKEILRRLWVTS